LAWDLLLTVSITVNIYLAVYVTARINRQKIGNQIDFTLHTVSQNQLQNRTLPTTTLEEILPKSAPV
jgi:hypothetical protein